MGGGGLIGLEPKDDAGAEDEVRGGFGEAEAGADAEGEVVDGAPVSGGEEFMLAVAVEVATGFEAEGDGVDEFLPEADAVAPGWAATFREDADEVEDEFGGGGEVGVEEQAGVPEVVVVVVDAAGVMGVAGVLFVGMMVFFLMTVFGFVMVFFFVGVRLGVLAFGELVTGAEAEVEGKGI